MLTHPGPAARQRAPVKNRSRVQREGGFRARGFRRREVDEEAPGSSGKLLHSRASVAFRDAWRPLRPFTSHLGMNTKQDSGSFPAYRGQQPMARGATPSGLDMTSPESIPDLAEDLHR